MKCKTQGCEREAKVRGWCRPHYVREWKRVNVSIEAREGNELYATWCNKKHNRAPEWDSFEEFKKDVGSYRAGSRLTRLDKAKPWGPGNVEWREVDMPRQEGETWSQYNVRASTRTKLRQKYSLTVDQYWQMHSDQGGVCAICKLPERPYPNGSERKLAVDHCHESGLVRELLCSTCNTSLGGFKDDPKLLLTAVEYLKKHHSENANEVPQVEHQHPD